MYWRYNNNVYHQMPLCVYLLENTDCSSQSNITCQPNIEEFANQQEKSQEDMENMDLQDSAKESST